MRRNYGCYTDLDASSRSVSRRTQPRRSESSIAVMTFNSLQRKVGLAAADKQFRKELLHLFPPPCGSAVVSA